MLVDALSTRTTGKNCQAYTTSSHFAREMGVMNIGIRGIFVPFASALVSRVYFDTQRWQNHRAESRRMI